MSLILCRQEPVRHPYYVENLGIHIYSSQELCYVIYNHLMLVLDGFVDDSLITFIRDELDMGFTALKLERYKKSGENPDDMLILILQECDYYTTLEISKFRSQIQSIRRMKPLEYQKTKADYLFACGQYGKAIASYKKILEDGELKEYGDQFAGRIYNNLASAYARIFQFKRAYQAFQISYGYLKDISIVQKLYFLTKMDRELTLGERFQALASEDRKRQWDERLEQAREIASESDKIQELNLLFQKDPIKRMAGAAQMVQGWKQEYRNMA